MVSHGTTLVIVNCKLLSQSFCRLRTKISSFKRRGKNNIQPDEQERNSSRTERRRRIECETN